MAFDNKLPDEEQADRPFSREERRTLSWTTAHDASDVAHGAPETTRTPHGVSVTLWDETTPLFTDLPKG